MADAATRPRLRAAASAPASAAELEGRIAALTDQLGEAREALRQSNERHALVSQAVAEGIYDWDIAQNSLWVSPRLIELFGWDQTSPSAGERPSQEWNARVHPDEFENYRIALRAALKGETPQLHCEYRIRLSGGEYRWVEDHAVPLRDERGWAVRLVGAVSDVTERKEREQALRERTRDLQESLEYQTATNDVLKVISRSTFDLQPILDTVIGTAARLCDAEKAILYRHDNGAYRFAAGHSNEPEYERIERATPIYPGEGTVAGRAALHKRAVQIVDPLADPLYAAKDEARVGKARSMIGVPLLRDGTPIGVIALARERIEPFTNRQIELVQTFADQAVIAIENARLLNETHEALEQQTATAEVLGIINSSPGDLAPVFDAMLDRAIRLCDAAYGHFRTYDGGRFPLVAVRGDPCFVELMQNRAALSPGPHHPVTCFVQGERILHFPDAAQTEGYRNDARFRTLVDSGACRALLAVALRKDGKLLGYINVYRAMAGAFSEQQIALLQSFADQAVIAMDNARLISETREARDDAETALHELKVAQASLIHAEKMASLGQLTAGIAHEIKNPLNFVNNFAALSVELLGELKETAAPGIAALVHDKRVEIDETIEMLTSNLDKIGAHGRRADGIVKSMLAHSRGTSGERQSVDLNALIEEALNLAYHGARAQDQNFNITLERDFAARIAPIELVPQDVTRVFLNLIGNGFHAAHKRLQSAADSSFRPILKVTTLDLGDAVEVRVRDNGTGIRPEHRDKLFQPFFTTKPTGEGTGLGLSISYDIVTQQHGGTITADSEVGCFTEFTVHLPRDRETATIRRE